jgi:hypothetical protein
MACWITKLEVVPVLCRQHTNSSQMYHIRGQINYRERHKITTSDRATLTKSVRNLSPAAVQFLHCKANSNLEATYGLIEKLMCRPITLLMPLQSAFELHLWKVCGHLPANELLRKLHCNKQVDSRACYENLGAHASAQLSSMNFVCFLHALPYRNGP